MSAPRLPTPNDAVAAVAAAQRVMPARTPFPRIETIAFAALSEAFPGAPGRLVAEALGVDPDWDHAAALALAEHQAWWREDFVNEVVGVLVAPLYGEQAR